jgi:hypothetical protein
MATAELIIEVPTSLKLTMAQAAALPTDQKYEVNPGESFALSGFRQARNHYQVDLLEPILGQSTWFAFAEHVTIEPEVVEPGELPLAHLIDVPYRNQRNNWLNPDGACNVTCVAMVLLFLGIRPSGQFPQFEDELYNYMESNGMSRHCPYDLSRTMRDYGISNQFAESASVEQVKAHIAGGNPAILHGYFTAFGHIVVVIGYDEYGWIIHDPYGEWNDWGYTRNSSTDVGGTIGKAQHYSYRLIEETCAPDGGMWAHFPSSPSQKN